MGWLPDDIFGISLYRFAAVVVGVVVLFLGVAYWYMFSMPGASHRGKLPPLSDAQVSAADRLRGHVEKLAGEIGVRNIDHPEAYRRAADYLIEQLESWGYSPKRRSFEVDGVETANIVVEKPGGKESAEIVVVGAHYDSVSSSPGADDNASGVASALELARRFRDVETRRTLRIVFFANEEAPYFGGPEMGSWRYARDARESGARIVSMFSLEMLGYYSTEVGSQKYPAGLSWIYPERGHFVAFVGNLWNRGLVASSISEFRRNGSFPSYGIAAPQFVPGISLSDHSAFWVHDFPAVMVTDTAFFRNDHYHRRSDTPETLDYERMARVVDGLEAVVAGQAKLVGSSMDGR